MAELAAPHIDAHQLSKDFGEVRALGDVSVSVRGGEVLALLGRSGAGKTTLLRILAGLLVQDAGSLSVCGRMVSDSTREAREHVAVSLADDRSWYWPLSARANLAFFGVLQGLTPEETHSRANRWLSEFDLQGAADRPVGHLSAGMRLRLSIIRAVIDDRPIIVLDEPTRSLDPANQRIFRGIARRLADSGRTLVLATHSIMEAVEIADQAVVLRQGAVTLHTTAPDEAELQSVLDPEAA